MRESLKTAYWSMKGIIARIIGTSYYEKKWSKRGIDEVRAGFSNLDHPHREWLMDNIFKKLYPFSSVLEFGCGYGPNLQIMNRKFPEVSNFVGVDVNPFSIAEGNKQLDNLGINKIKLIKTNDSFLRETPVNAFDIVFTDAVLFLIAPDKINQVLLDMARVSKKALFLVELHQQNLKGNCIHTQDGWVRDYRKLLSRYFDYDQISLTKIPREIWPAGRWPDLGHVIIARKI